MRITARPGPPHSPAIGQQEQACTKPGLAAIPEVCSAAHGRPHAGGSPMPVLLLPPIPHPTQGPPHFPPLACALQQQLVLDLQPIAPSICRLMQARRHVHAARGGEQGGLLRAQRSRARGPGQARPQRDPAHPLPTPSALSERRQNSTQVPDRLVPGSLQGWRSGQRPLPSSLTGRSAGCVPPGGHAGRCRDRCTRCRCAARPPQIAGLHACV
jgi:hypothetical protein